MKILALDTSTKFLSVACLENNDVKGNFHEDAGVRHSEILVPTIKNMLEEIKWPPKDIDLICVGLGPGSFTGLRIAIATVKAFAAVLDSKVVGVPTMDAIVMNRPTEEKRLAPFIDARKDKVYTCVYDNTGDLPERMTDYLLVSAEDFLKNLTEKVFFFGDAAVKYKKELDSCPLAMYSENADWYPRAVEIGRIGLERSQAATDEAGSMGPLYMHSQECNIGKGKGKR